MSLSQEPWTLEYLTALPDDELDRVGRRVAGDVVISRLHAGRVILAMERTGLPARLGLSSAIHYFILAGFKRVEALECRRVAHQCEPLPKISAAAEAGTVGWTYLREIVRVASVETEETWLELCRRKSSKMVQQLVKHTKPGEDPLKPQGERPHPGALEVELRVTLPAEVNAMLARAMRELSLKAGRPLSPRAALECLLAHYLSGHAFPGELAWQRLLDQAQGDLEAERDAERREVDVVRGEAENSREFPEAPWEAVAATETSCPGEPELQLIQRSPAQWQNERLHFSGEVRHLTEPQRRELLRRDAYRCASPDCPHHVWLQVHHVVFYCRGG